MSNRKQAYFFVIALCMTLGLAPFTPEPHLVGKIRWLLGDPTSMQAMDWFDVAMHGAPFVALGYLLVRDLLERLFAK